MSLPAVGLSTNVLVTTPAMQLAVPGLSFEEQLEDFMKMPRRGMSGP